MKDGFVAVAGHTGVPESILNSEVAGWTPAETPRGRRQFADWIRTGVPDQLRASTRRWIEYVANREVNPDAQTPKPAPVQQIPDVTYSIREGDGKRFFIARPSDGLGPAWQMNEHGEISEEAPAKNARQDF